MTSELNELIDRYGSEGVLSDESPANLKRWLGETCFADYHDRIGELLTSGDSAKLTELNDMFWTTIPFGTGGRRGIMGEMGPATMNARTIAESAHGLATYMKQQKGRETGTAVVAHDTRRNSQLFARITASTFAAHGLKVYVFGPHKRTIDVVGADEAAAFTHRSTPLLSFAVRHLNCDVGVMISASHNPPSDNGFKAYWDNGAQVIAPHDKGIIDCVNAATDIPAIDFDEAVAAGSIVVLDDAVDETFAKEVLAVGLCDKREVNAVFSPLHGVGETAAFDVLDKAGFAGVRVFEDHRRPDPDFTNVADQFPNPERTQVFERIIAAEQDSDCELILATDPDADRVSIAVRDEANNFVNLTGNQIGALVCDYVCRQRKATGQLKPENFVVETLVTTPLTATIARSHGIRAFTELLVGFKHIAKTIDDNGPDDFIFGTEESIGYLAGQYARDKCAAVGCLYIMEMAAELKADGKTILQRLDELYAEHGVHAEGQKSIYCKGSAGLQQIKTLMETYRSSPPTELAGLTLQRLRDYQSLEIKSPSGEVIETITQPQGNLVFLEFADDSGNQISVAGRPSGTEPKIKFYFFLQGEPGADVGPAKSAAADLLAKAESSLDEWAQSVLNG